MLICHGYYRKNRETHTVIQNGDNEDHERCKIKFPDQGNQHKAKLQIKVTLLIRDVAIGFRQIKTSVSATYHNTDGDGNCINLVQQNETEKLV